MRNVISRKFRARTAVCIGIWLGEKLPLRYFWRLICHAAWINGSIIDEGEGPLLPKLFLEPVLLRYLPPKYETMSCLTLKSSGVL